VRAKICALYSLYFKREKSDEYVLIHLHHSGYIEDPRELNRVNRTKTLNCIDKFTVESIPEF